MGPPALPPNWCRWNDCFGLSAAVVEEAVGVQNAVPFEVVGDPVNVVGAGLRDHVDHASGGAPELRVETVGLDLELLHRVDRWIDDAAVDVGSGVGAAVEQDLLGAGAAASHVEIRLEEVAADILAAAVAEIRAEDHARREGHQGKWIADVQGEVDDAPRGHHLAEGRRLGIERGRRGGDRHLLGRGPGYQCHVDLERLVDLKGDGALLEALEPGHRAAQAVGGGREIREAVNSRRIRNGGVYRAGREVGHSELRTRDHGAGRIGHHPGHLGVETLAVETGGKSADGKQTDEQIVSHVDTP